MHSNQCSPLKFKNVDITLNVVTRGKEEEEGPSQNRVFQKINNAEKTGNEIIQTTECVPKEEAPKSPSLEA